MITKSLFQHYQQLLQGYGNPAKYWPQWCAKTKSVKEREKIIIGMILVQRTSWHNANIALKNLKKENLLSAKRISELKSLDELIRLIRPAGFYQSKPQRLFDVCEFVTNRGGVVGLMKREASALRSALLKTKGVGQETADTILLYALDKPIFVIDEYTRRWTEINRLTPEKDYLKLQQFFHRNLDPDLTVYQNFHTLIIVCQKGVDKSVMEVV